MISFEPARRRAACSSTGWTGRHRGGACAGSSSTRPGRHIDLNFGCPVPKVTRKGGGSALPWRRRLFGRIVREAVAAAAPAGVPSRSRCARASTTIT
jgi:hypothetical protein